MMIKTDKETLLQLIYASVENNIHNELHNGIHNSEEKNNGVNLYVLANVIQAAVAIGVQAGFRTLLENQYTDEEFEQDLTIK